GDEPPMKELLEALAGASKLDVAGAQQLAQQFFSAREQAADNFELLARLLEEILSSKLLGAKFTAAAGEKSMAEVARNASVRGLVECLEAAVRAREAIDAMATARVQAEQWWISAAEALRGS
ncbi:MAG TPA: hypothetical protein VEJ86_04445, partial [Candidatus Binataceae bacterium]|nr:hypothetical protein [Candidatus Binataceae bacterium]